MQPLPDDISPNDVHQWIGRGVFLANVPGKGIRIFTFGELLFEGSFEEWEPDSMHIEAQDVESRDTTMLSPAQVMIHWPLFGAVNIAPEGRFKGAAYYVRRQARQHYTRTYTPRVVEVAPVARWELCRAEVRFRNMRSADPALLRALFFPSYPEYPEARSMLDSGEYLSVALSRHVSLLANDLGGYVCYGGRPTGKLRGGEFVPFGDTPEAARCERLLEKVL